MVILCTIDLETREVSLPAGQVIASYDHNVDVIRFQVETIPGFSLDTSSIRIAAQGPNKARHDYAVDPSTVAIEEETGYITFDWPIPQGVTEMPIGSGFKYGDKGQLIFAVCAEIISGDTVSKAWHSDDGIITVVAHLEPEAGGGEDPEEEATNAQKIGQLQTSITVLGTQVGALANGSPTPVSTVAEMTDESAVYLYTGSETGYTAGNWYFWNGSAWTSGGTYGGAVTDTTLSISGKAADAKAVGDALALKADDTDVTALDTRVTAIENGSSGNVQGIGVNTIVALTQEEYDAIGTKSDTTLYIITDRDGGGTLPSYSVTNNLTHITTNNNATNVIYGNVYSATLTPDTNYYIDSVTVTMGGVDITSTAYSNGIINISSVTGVVVITAIGDTSLVSVPYLESDGESFINTGYVPTKTGLVIEAKAKNIDTTAGLVTFGAFTFNKEQMCMIGDGSGWINFKHDGVTASVKVSNTSKTHVFRRTATEVYIDDMNTPVKTVSAGSQIATNPFSIFAKSDGNGKTAYRLYYIKIFDTNGTTLLHEYIPAENNGAACVYDTVSQEYYYNQGSGTLTYGTELME